MAVDKTIPAKEIIMALETGGPVHGCKSCGARMFVRTPSGLCPVCFNVPRPVSIDELLSDVLDDTLPNTAARAELRRAESYAPRPQALDPFDDFARFDDEDDDSFFESL